MPRGHEGWLKSKRMVLFEIENYASHVYVKLILGPGDQGIRERMHEHVMSHPSVFNRATSKFYPKWWTSNGERWLKAKQYDELTLDELEALVTGKMVRLVEEQSPGSKKPCYRSWRASRTWNGVRTIPVVASGRPGDKRRDALMEARLTVDTKRSPARCACSSRRAKAS